jgi:hypothetical protein
LAIFCILVTKIVEVRMIDTNDCFLETYGLKLPHYEEKNSEFTTDNWFQCASIMFVT